MKKSKTKDLAVLLLSVSMLACASGAWAINWKDDLAAALTEAKAKGSPVMADFYTDWCGWCKKLDKDVYGDSGIDKIAGKFICVKVNCEADRASPAKYGVRGFPTIIFFDPEGEAVETIVGYRSAQVFADTMNKVLDKLPRPEAAQAGIENPPDKPVTMKGEPDIVYLNNGRSVSGVILKEDAASVELETGGGSVVMSRSVIKSVHHARPEALAEFKGSLKEKQDALMSKEKVFADQREKRFEEYGNWAEDEARHKAERQRKEGEVDIVRDTGSNAVLVQAVLNGGVKATLIIDTGADVLVLSRNIGDKLGIDMSTGPGEDLRDLRLAGGKTVKVKMKVLKSVDIQGIEEKDVLAAVLLDDSGVGFKDGLLGRTFLGRFNMSLDLEKMKMALKKLV